MAQSHFYNPTLMFSIHNFFYISLPKPTCDAYISLVHDAYISLVTPSYHFQCLHLSFERLGSVFNVAFECLKD